MKTDEKALLSYSINALNKYFLDCIDELNDFNCKSHIERFRDKHSNFYGAIRKYLHFDLTEENVIISICMIMLKLGKEHLDESSYLFFKSLEQRKFTNKYFYLRAEQINEFNIVFQDVKFD